MLSAAEAAIDDAAADETERQRNRAKLYMPPRSRDGRRMRPAGTRLDAAGAQALMAQLAAEDARLAGGRTS
ncbi:hypothetical protein AB0F92_22685 [Kitasatospora aureofaciens]|uniref:hypothetical protein n=1 Tax=Kitasatospora aureofaciens TaxID=1894 RepID=UPI0009337C13|nr:hypothetical protein CP971_05535 [Streptomyces viridifaciens]UKZ04829.1 hypothetical protein BOQ63_012390 [Streptomyces viridifaciens]